MSCVAIIAQIAPFASGAAGGTLGALQCAIPVYAVNPATSAAFLNLYQNQGCSIDALRYYTATTGTARGAPLRLTGGYWFANAYLSCKGACSFFNAWGIYREEELLVSLATPFFKKIVGSGDLRIVQARIATGNSQLSHRTFYAGETVHYSGKSIHIVAQCGDIVLAQTETSLRKAFIRGSIESVVFWGAQGFSFEYRRGEEMPYRIAASEEFALGKNAGLSVSIATNPALVAVAFWGTVNRATGHGQFINHPILGWSEGGGASFSFR